MLKLEFTFRLLVLLIADGPRPKLKQPDYDSKLNRGGQAPTDVKLATVHHLKSCSHAAI